MAKKEEKKEETAMTAPPTSTALSTPNYGADAGSGFEEMDASYIQIPWLNIMQPMSPAVVEARDGARAGMMFHTGSGSYYDGPRLFVPSSIKKMITRWTPRDSGGGFRGMIEPNDPEWADAQRRSKAFGEYFDQDGNELVDTFYVHGTLVGPEVGEVLGPVGIACASTKIKPVKQWISRMQEIKMRGPAGDMVPVPLFCHLIQIGTVLEKNKKGQPYYNFSWTAAVKGADGHPNLRASLLDPEDSRFLAAKSLRESITAGNAKFDPGKAQDAEGRRGAHEEGAPF